MKEAGSELIVVNSLNEGFKVLMAVSAKLAASFCQIIFYFTTFLELVLNRTQ